MKFIYLTLLMVAVQFQIGISQTTPKLQACKDKITEQISQLHFGQFPTCFNVSKLGELRTNTNTIQELFQTLSDNCRKPTADDVKSCIGVLQNFLILKSSELRAELVNAIHKVFESSRDCVSSFVDIISNLDEWIGNGCE